MVYRVGDRTVWKSVNAETGQIYVALFNLRDSESEVSVTLEQLAVSGTFAVRDLWKREDIGTTTSHLSASLRPHASAFYVLTKV